MSSHQLWLESLSHKYYCMFVVGSALVILCTDWFKCHNLSLAGHIQVRAVSDTQCVCVSVCVCGRQSPMITTLMPDKHASLTLVH